MMRRILVVSLLVTLAFAPWKYAVRAQGATETCSLDDPLLCSSCRALGGTTSKLEGKALSEGRKIEGVTWTPLFTAYFFNCQDLGRTLVRRGANVNAGGRNGGLLAEVATQRALNPDPKNFSINIAWTSIIESGLVDLDAPVAQGYSNREIWSGPASPAGQRNAEIWARFELRSVSTPLKPDEIDADVDAPTTTTGRTRPAESPVSKGVEKFFVIMPKSGMVGLSVEISGCYDWAQKIDKPFGRRIALENCAALDIVAKSFDTEVTSQMSAPPTPFFESARFEGRMNQIREQNFDGMIWPVYRRNLEVSAMLWFSFHYELSKTRKEVEKVEHRDPQKMIAQWREFNGQCRGGPGDQPAALEACQRRAVVGHQLSEAGYCYGRQGEYGYQMAWHRCGPTSLRP